MDDWKLIYMDNWKLIFLKCIDTLILGSAVGRTFTCVISHMIYFNICLFILHSASTFEEGCVMSHGPQILVSFLVCAPVWTHLKWYHFGCMGLDLIDVVQDTKLCYKYLSLFKIKLNLSPHGCLTTLNY